MCIDRALAAAAVDRLPQGPPVLVYEKGRVPVDELMRKVESWVSSESRHFCKLTMVNDHSQ